MRVLALVHHHVAVDWVMSVFHFVYDAPTPPSCARDADCSHLSPCTSASVRINHFSLEDGTAPAVVAEGMTLHLASSSCFGMALAIVHRHYHRHHVVVVDWPLLNFFLDLSVRETQKTIADAIAFFRHDFAAPIVEESSRTNPVTLKACSSLDEMVALVARVTLVAAV